MAVAYDGTGRLQVRAVTAGGALPVEGALVTVAGADPQNKDIRVTLLTDNVGKTEEISLPAPAAALSLSPGTRKPYAAYNITVERADFYVHQALNVPVFDRVVSIQTSELIPRSYTGEASEAPRMIDTVDESNPYLGGSGKEDA